jgi:two-component system cell cycle sensor histidine kinase/response regulator CckA
MPGLRGPELVRRLFSLRPDTPILYISGHTDSEPIQRPGPGPVEALLQKPFTAEALARKIREILDGSAG